MTLEETQRWLKQVREEIWQQQGRITELVRRIEQQILEGGYIQNEDPKA